MKFPPRTPVRIKPVVAGLLAVALVSLATGSLVAQDYYPQPQQDYPQPAYQDPSQQQYYPPQQGSQQMTYAPQGQAAAPMMAQQQAMDPGQLEQLVAPIALYPDALVAQILAGATYPAQLAAADQWVHQFGAAGPDQVAAMVSSQTQWDPSIKALTAYPQVLDMLAGNLQWTTVLGNAYYNQPQDVLQTVQVMRMRAQQAGTLVNTPQMQVMQNAGYISLAPPTDDTMYVPTYNPWTAYGDPVQPYPGFSFTGILGTLANAFLGGGFGGNGYGGGIGGGALQFLSSFALGAFNRTPFGLISWGLDWLFNALTFHHNDYYTASTSVRDWGMPHGGPRYRGYARASFAGNRYGSFGNGYNHQAINIHGRSGYEGRFGGNTAIDRTHQAFGNGGVRAEYQHQMAFNHGQQPAFGNQFNSARGQYGNNFAGRGMDPRMSQPQRPVYARGNFGGMQSRSFEPARQAYQNPMGGAGSYAMRGGYGQSGSYVQRGGMAYNPSSGFRQDRGSYGSGFARSSNDWGGSGRSGGFFGGGGGSYKAPKFSEPKFKEPKMPKMQSFKAPKEHFGGGGHFGGGHSGGGHGGGGHFGGGHHH